jgi:hypothetical protein
MPSPIRRREMHFRYTLPVAKTISLSQKSHMALGPTVPSGDSCICA